MLCRRVQCTLPPRCGRARSHQCYTPPLATFSPLMDVIGPTAGQRGRRARRARRLAESLRARPARHPGCRPRRNHL